MTIDDLKKIIPNIIIKLADTIKFPENIQISIASNNKKEIYNYNTQYYDYYSINKKQINEIVERKVSEELARREKEIEKLPDNEQIKFVVNSSSTAFLHTIADIKSNVSGSIDTDDLETEQSLTNQSSGSVPYNTYNTNDDDDNWSVIGSGNKK